MFRWPRTHSSTLVRALALAAASAAGLFCALPEPRDLVSERAERRMSANQLHNLGRNHLEAGDFASCVRVYEEVVTRKRMAPAFVNLGLCYEGQREFAKARRAFDAAVKADGGTVALLARAWLAYQTEDQAGFVAHRARLARTSSSAVARLDSWRQQAPSLEARAAAPMRTPRQAPLGIFGN